jgi:catecholate siderophore receptor
MLEQDTARALEAASGASSEKSDLKTVGALSLGFASMLAATGASAQDAVAPQAEQLPPVEVTAQPSPKKKKPAVKKKAPPAETYQPAPEPVEATAVPSGSPGTGQGRDSYKTDSLSSSKATGPLINTPQTVSVIPGTIIQERAATNLVDVLKNTPGITFDAGENGFGSGPNQFNLRGFNSVGSVFIDGVRDNGSYTRDTYNVDRVEVIKGPAADNGRGTGGGYINIVTKTPQLGNFVRGDVGIGFDQYDSEMRRRATVDINQSSGTTAARLNAMVQDGGVAGRDVAEANAWGLAPSLAFGLGTNFRTVIAYEHLERRDVPDSGVAFNRSTAAYSVGIKGAGLNPYFQNTPRDTFYGERTDFDDVNSDSVLARFEYDLAPGLTISNQTRWADINREARYHFASSGNIPGNIGYYDRTNKSLNNQTNLMAKFDTGGIKHTVSTGVEFAREESDAFRFPNQTSNVKIDTAAVYAYDTIELNRQWQLVGGIRVEHYDAELAGNSLPGGPAYSDSDVTVGGKAGIVYKPVEEGSLYAAYSLSHLPHGSLLSNPDVSRTGGNGFPGFVPNADPVELHNYEVGVKWDFFGGRLSTTGALFRTEKHNVAYPGVAPHPAIVYGEQVVQGLELGVAGNLTDRMKVFGGLLVMDSERKHGVDVDDSLRGGGGGNDYNGALTTNGDELAFTPNVFASLWLTYDVTDRLTLGGGVQYVGDSWIGRPDDALRVIKNGTYGKVPDYFLVNLMASYELTENLDLRLNVDNVFNEQYLTTANWNGSWGYLGAPRTFWLSTSFKY